MASNHEVIKWKVITDWTKSKRGRLYCCNQGMATPIDREHPIWFGPLKRNFKGFPDLFGFNKIPLAGPRFCTVEVKTKAYPTISEAQKRVMTELIKSFGVDCYIAKEFEERYKLYLFIPDESKRGYRLEEVEM